MRHLMKSLLIGVLLLWGAGALWGQGKPRKTDTRYFSHFNSERAREVAEIQSDQKKPPAQGELLPYSWLNRNVQQYNGRIPIDNFTRYFLSTPRDLLQPPGR
jgi:hypothetical protein